MKYSAFWNYEEKIEFRVLNTRLRQVTSRESHWQNAFVGEICQIIEVIPPGKDKSFFIDNEDGSGLLKLVKNGGPDSYHASIGDFDLIEEVPIAYAKFFDPIKHKERRIKSDLWMKEHFPELHKKLEALRKAASKLQS